MPLQDSATKPSALFDAAEYGSTSSHGPQTGSIEVPPEQQPKRIKDAKLLSLLKRQGFMCPYTGRKLTPANTDIVFHVPLAKGGLNDPENIRLVHRDAAEAKGGLTFDELLSLCRDVVRSADAV